MTATNIDKRLWANTMTSSMHIYAVDHDQMSCYKEYLLLGVEWIANLIEFFGLWPLLPAVRSVKQATV